MKKKITINLSAHSLPAGKYDPDAPLCGNEDNFYVYDTTNKTVLAMDNPMDEDYNAIVRDNGIVLVVADGMGGTNAGEVASEIAVSVVQKRFNATAPLATAAISHKKRMRYMEETIVMADKAIKQHAKEHAECEGMGSTLIIAWIVDNEMSVSWCGDSRCYCFHPDDGISMVSHDHSYVQELADKQVLTYEQTFNHPQGNIITRSLGDHNSIVHPQSVLYYVADGDIVMLCSDGLSGVLFDYKARNKDGDLLSEENIEDIIRANQESMSQCSKELFAAAERADWYDNVTILLCKICNGAKKMTHKTLCTRHKTVWPWIVGIIVLAIVTLLVWPHRLNEKDVEVTKTSTITKKSGSERNQYLPQEDSGIDLRQGSGKMGINSKEAQAAKHKLKENQSDTSRLSSLISTQNKKDTVQNKKDTVKTPQIKQVIVQKK